MIPLYWFLILAAILFCLGVYAVITRRNTVAILMGIELMLNAANINLLAFWRYLYADSANLDGIIFALIVFAAAAAETAVGLGLILSAYRRKETIVANDLDSLKGNAFNRMLSINSLIWMIPLPPLLGFALIAILTYRSKRISHIIGLIGAGLSFLASMVLVIKAITTHDLAAAPLASSINWLPTGETWLKIGVLVDPLTAVMLFFVAWTILMIFIYSVGYHNFGQPVGEHDRPGLPPAGAQISEHGKVHKVPSVEPMYSKFFALLSLFAFAMYLLVVSDSLLTLYIGWEIMGFCSYFLIGFWYGKESARNAGIKAFLTTRIGDVFMLLGIAALYSVTGTLNFQAIFSDPGMLEMLATTASPVSGWSWSTLIGVLLFCGTIGKSAQFPLHVWLPDAMEGPTPVSAMIHAATMVSAGVLFEHPGLPDHVSRLGAGWRF